MHAWTSSTDEGIKEKNTFLEMSLEQMEWLMVQNKNDQEKQQKAWSTLTASWEWSSQRTNPTEMFRAIKRTKKWRTTTEELKFWLMNQMQICNFPRNEKKNTSKGASCSEWASGKRRRPNVFTILLKTTKKWMAEDGNDEIMEQNLQFAKIRLKSVTHKCCRNFNVDADEE